MFAYPFRTTALTLCAAVGLSACTTNPYGYSGVSVGVGNAGYYDPYYGSGYGGYGYGAGYPGYGYGFDPYWGWNDGLYYPGTGYYVYDSHRRAHRWTAAQRRYWELRRQRALTSNTRERIVIRDNWDDFANHIDGGRRIQSSVEQPVRVKRTVRVERPVRVERSIAQPAKTEGSQERVQRSAVRAERSSERGQRRSETRSEEGGRSNGHRREDSRQD